MQGNMFMYIFCVSIQRVSEYISVIQKQEVKKSNGQKYSILPGIGRKIAYITLNCNKRDQNHYICSVIK